MILLIFIGPARRSLFRVKDSSVIQVLDAEPGRLMNLNLNNFYINILVLHYTRKSIFLS